VDDTYLVVPGKNSHLCKADIDHLRAWAARNNLLLNGDKTKEIVFSACRKQAPPPPPPPLPPKRPGIERVTSLRILGVIVNNKLTAADHVTMLLSSCSRMFYAMRVLRARGTPTTSLHDIFHATVVSRIVYAAPAWSGMCSAADCARLDSILRRSKRLGYCRYDQPAMFCIHTCQATLIFLTNSAPVFIV